MGIKVAWINLKLSSLTIVIYLLCRNSEVRVTPKTSANSDNPNVDTTTIYSVQSEGRHVGNQSGNVITVKAVISQNAVSADVEPSVHDEPPQEVPDEQNVIQNDGSNENDDNDQEMQGSDEGGEVVQEIRPEMTVEEERQQQEKGEQQETEHSTRGDNNGEVEAADDPVDEVSQQIADDAAEPETVS